MKMFAGKILILWGGLGFLLHNHILSGVFIIQFTPVSFIKAVFIEHLFPLSLDLIFFFKQWQCKDFQISHVGL